MVIISECLRERFILWRGALRWGWIVIVAIWGVLTAFWHFRDNFLSPSLRVQLDTYAVTSRCDWHVWAIGFLVILIAASLEGCYRQHKEILQSALARLGTPAGGPGWKELLENERKTRNDEKVALAKEYSDSAGRLLDSLEACRVTQKKVGALELLKRQVEALRLRTMNMITSQGKPAELFPDYLRYPVLIKYLPDLKSWEQGHLEVWSLQKDLKSYCDTTAAEFPDVQTDLLKVTESYVKIEDLPALMHLHQQALDAYAAKRLEACANAATS
jgi:hypothetical protein